MKIGPITINEEERLAAIQKYGILDTEFEIEYDDIVKLASQLCDTPIALITFVDRDRQWFKAKIGLEMRETHRDLSFCAHTISKDDFLIVPDALLDKRFSDNPLVLHNPSIRFYAGLPLVTSDGFKLGTLVVIDRKPRE